MKKYLIIPIVAFVILIFIFGIYAGATKTFPYNIIKSVKDEFSEKREALFIKYGEDRKKTNPAISPEKKKKVEGKKVFQII